MLALRYMQRFGSGRKARLQLSDGLNVISYFPSAPCTVQILSSIPRDGRGGDRWGDAMSVARFRIRFPPHLIDSVFDVPESRTPRAWLVFRAGLFSSLERDKISGHVCIIKTRCTSHTFGRGWLWACGWSRLNRISGSAGGPSRWARSQSDL